MDDAGRDDVEELTLEPVTVVRSRRPRALWGVLAVVAVTAGALVVVSAGDDGASRPGLPVALGSASSTEAAGAAADARMAWTTYVAGDDLPALGGEAAAYRLAGSVDEGQVRALADALGVVGEVVHEGPAWRVTGAAGTLEVYEGGGAQWWYSSATAGGGDVGSGSSGSSGSSGGSASVDPCAPTHPSDDVCDLPTATTYHDCGASDDDAPTCPVPVEGGTPADCPPGADCPVPLPEPIEPPAPPADLPSEEEARAIALDLLAATGLDTDDAVVTVDGPYDAWYVMVEPRIDDIPSGLLASATVGSEGEVTSAGGYLGTPERLGDYPLLTTHDAIDRANAQMADGGWFAYAPDTAVASDTAVLSVEGAPAGDDPVTTSTAACEACEPIDDQPVATAVDEPATTVTPCKVQPDGSEICETEPGIACPQQDPSLGAPETLECVPPEPGPAPAPIEVVLVDAEPTLVMLPAIDGSSDAYLVPGYRFTDDDGGQVDLPAVADEALTGTPETTVPEESIAPDPGGVDPIDPGTCRDVLVQEDESGTTHTVQPNRDCVDPDPATLAPGEEPQIGVGYYVDMQVMDGHCTWISVEFAGRWWIAQFGSGDLAEWSTPTEGGTFTLLEADRAEFVGDAQRTKVAELTVWEDGSQPPACA